MNNNLKEIKTTIIGSILFLIGKYMLGVITLSLLLLWWRVLAFFSRQIKY
jgi:ABC-type multidrug transport system permease subunit